MALHGTLNHRKTRRLAKLLGIDPCYALGIIEAVFHVTAKQQPDGGIGRLSNCDISDEILYSGDPDQLIAFLVEAKILDESPEIHRLYVHDWHDWCDHQTISKLVHKRQLFANGAMPSLAKYGQDRRAHIESEYAERAHGAHDAHGAHGAHGAPRARARPEPEPEPVEESSTHRSISLTRPARNTAAVVRRRPSVAETDTVEIPDKRMPPLEPAAPAASAAITGKALAVIHQLIWDYMAMKGTGMDRKVPPPDAAIVDRCLLAIGSAALGDVRDYLRSLFTGDQSPRHPSGPKSYAWFPTVLARRFSPGSELLLSG